MRTVPSMGLARAAIGVAISVAAIVAIAGRARADAIPPRIARALALDGATRRSAAMPRRYPRATLDDLSREASGAALAWERFGTTGEGAAICVVDTGVDLRHHDFRDAGGRTRARFVADLEGAPRGGAESDLEARHGAAIWSAEEIDAALAAGTPLPGDPHGHGTAIASAALGDDAGEGEREPGEHAGVAPRAALIVVRALRAGAVGFEDADVIAGVELCVALAGRDPEIDLARTAILLSLGGHDGAHDGREPLERALAAIAGDGHAIVVAAGNDGGRAIHASGRALPGAPARIEVHVPTPRGEGEQWVALAVRSDARVSLFAEDGARADARDGEVVMVSHAGGYLLVDASAPREDGARFVRAAIGGGGGGQPPLRPGDYVLQVAGDDLPFDAWIVGAELGPALGAPSLRGPHAGPAESVTIPATAPALIAVGASISRARAGELALEARDDGSATFSAIGPAAGGAARPDVIAPGGLVAAALSGDLDPADPSNLFAGSRAAIDRRRWGEDRVLLEGTSVAAAIVAGAHALAYALAPAEPARDRALLLASAAGEGAWSAGAGAGALRIDRWIELRAGDPGLSVDPARSAIAPTRAIALPRARDVRVVARLLDAEGRPVHGGELVLRARGGAELGRAEIAWGRADAAIAIDAPAGERVIVEAEAAGVALAPVTIEVRVDEGARGLGARPGGGACAIASAPRAASLPSVAPLALLAIALALAITRRRARDRG